MAARLGRVELPERAGSAGVADGDGGGGAGLGEGGKHLRAVLVVHAERGVIPGFFRRDDAGGPGQGAALAGGGKAGVERTGDAAARPGGSGIFDTPGRRPADHVDQRGGDGFGALGIEGLGDAGEAEAVPPARGGEAAQIEALGAGGDLGGVAPAGGDGR